MQFMTRVKRLISQSFLSSSLAPFLVLWPEKSELLSELVLPETTGVLRFTRFFRSKCECTRQKENPGILPPCHPSVPNAPGWSSFFSTACRVLCLFSIQCPTFQSYLEGRIGTGMFISQGSSQFQLFFYCYLVH